MISKLVSNTFFILILEKPGQQGGEAGGSDELVPSLLDLRVGKILDVKKVRKYCKPTLIRVRKKKMWKRLGREISRRKPLNFEVHRKMKSSRIIVGLQEHEDLLVSICCELFMPITYIFDFEGNMFLIVFSVIASRSKAILSFAV